MKADIAFVGLAGAIGVCIGLASAGIPCAMAVSARPAPVIERHYQTTPTCFGMLPLDLQPFEVEP